MDNPYEAPSADLSTADEQSDRLDIFKRFSTWYVFGLSIVTMNLYILYWFYSRTKTLNRLRGVTPISDNFMSVVIVFNIVTVPLSFADLVFGHSQNLLLVANICSFIAAVLLLIWAFKFRHRLNAFLEQYQLPHSKAGPVFTFLFQALHLSYKINENLELLERASVGPADDDIEPDNRDGLNRAEASQSL